MCARHRSDGKWNKSDDIVSKLVDGVESEIGQTLFWADECKFIHSTWQKKCSSKLKKDVYSSMKGIFWNLTLTPKKGTLVVTPNVLLFPEYWINHDGTPYDKYKYKVLKKQLETMEKETAQEHVDKDIVQCGTPASGKILYQT